MSIVEEEAKTETGADQAMPGMTGEELAEKVKDQDSAVKAVLLTITI